MSMTGRQRLDDMPSMLRWWLVAVKEVGFPIVCCCFLFYLVIVNNAKMTEALEKVTIALQTVQLGQNLLESRITESAKLSEQNQEILKRLWK